MPKAKDISAKQRDGLLGTLQARFEATNLLNHVNLHTPDAEIGVPGNDNPNAGRITKTAFDNLDPPRFFQFGLRFTF